VTNKFATTWQRAMNAPQERFRKETTKGLILQYPAPKVTRENKRNHFPQVTIVFSWRNSRSCFQL